jgi:hypothetical protein
LVDRPPDPEEAAHAAAAQDGSRQRLVRELIAWHATNIAVRRDPHRNASCASASWFAMPSRICWFAARCTIR